MAREEHTMVPREHGAYAELLFPIATVLLGGKPTTPTWLLAAAVLGERGNRAKRRDSGRAKRALLIFVLIALGAGIAGFILAPRGVRIAVVCPLLLGGGLVLMAVQGLERTMFGEALAAAALSSLAIPLGLSAGLHITAALAVTVIWFLASSLGTSIVRLTIARTKSKTEAAQRNVKWKRGLLILVCLFAIAVGVGAPFGSRVGLWVLAAAVPVALVVLVMAALRPTTRRLRLMGWSLVAANLCSLIAVVTTLKIIQDFKAVEPTLPFPMF
jgi:multidrug transporter EmrE-like cation transporter